MTLGYTKFISTDMLAVFKRFPLRFFSPLIDEFLACTWFNKKFSDCIAKENGNTGLAGIKFLDYLNITISIDSPENIPKEGAVQIIANHDGELLDVFMLLATCGKIRPDFKFLATAYIKNISIFNLFCFYTSFTSEAKMFYELTSFLANGAALLYFPFTFKLLLENKTLRHNISPLPYYLARKSLTPILPLRLHFKKTARGKAFKYLERFFINHELPRLARFLYAIDVIFSLRTLRAMQGKTASVKVKPLVLPPSNKLTKLEAMNFVKLTIA